VEDVRAGDTPPQAGDLSEVGDVSLGEESRRVLHTLLDRHEAAVVRRRRRTDDPGDGPRSPDGSRSLRRPFFRLTSATLPGYHRRDTARRRLAANRELVRLEQRGLIELFWHRHEEGERLDRVALNPEQAPRVYRLLRREEPGERLASLRRLLQSVPSRIHAQDAPDSVTARFVAAMLTRVDRGESTHPYLDPRDLDGADRVLTALSALERLRGEVSRRTFSARALGDSKAWPAIERRVLRIHRDYGDLELDDDHQLLAELGLVDNPQVLLLSGAVRIDLDGQPIDLRLFRPAVGLTPATVEALEVTALDTGYIVTVENLASFHDFVAGPHGPRAVTVFLGGYHNHARRRLLTKLARAAGPGVRYLHWGDIDLGGLQIWRHLVDRTRLPFAPWCMDVATLDRYREFARPLSPTQERRLRRAREENPGLAPFADLMDHMLAQGLWLEQENVRPEAERLPPR